MGFEELLPKGDELEEEPEILEKADDREKIGQNQFYDIITSKKPDWQTIIYDLIHTEQLDPWDIDLIVLTQKYFEKIHELEDTEYYISSKVLLAASLLLRIKSEFLLNKHLKSIDEILFGKREDSKTEIERIEIDEDDLPILMPKTPLPRARRVTLPELMMALNKAINTESRRIKREVAIKRAHKLSHVDIPKFRRVDLKDRIKQFYARVLTALKRKSSSPDKELNKIGFKQLLGDEKEQKLASFLPLLHLSNTKKLWLEQGGHLEEIWIYLYDFFNKNRDKFIEELEEDLDEMKEEMFENVEGNKLTGLQKARLKQEAKKKLQEQIKKELEMELGTELGDTVSQELEKEVEEIEKEEKIEKATGFAEE